MVQGFMQEYRPQVAACLMGKLVPYAHGGPTAGIGEIDAIGQIRQEKQQVDAGIEYTYHPVKTQTLFPMEGQQKEQDKEAVDVEDGGRVENEAGSQERQAVGRTPQVAIERLVHQHKQQSHKPSLLLNFYLIQPGAKIAFFTDTQTFFPRV